MRKISKEQIAINLNNAIHAEVGQEGLGKLLYGWLNYRRYGHRYREVIWHRKWFYIAEVHDLSDYAGYDLSISEY